jgi:DNA mismatch repair protein MutL
MSIKVLDARVISQIAAGEVIERPASVVKELLENSLDAGSTQITVEIQHGGISLIRITDNGSGISGDQAELAFQRHATSKIQDLRDLLSISTLGFRGEALPSIAAVAQVQMETSVPDAPAGTYLSLEDGQVIRHDPQARAAGTTITVHNLFRKMPARLKFLKSESAEGGRVADIVSQYALAYPEVKVSLIVNGKTTLRTSGSGKLLDSILAVYGVDVAGNMLEVKSETGNWDNPQMPITVNGYVSSPRLTRSSREYLSFFVNRRWVNNRMLSFAVEEAYHGLLMQGKHPIAVINIALPPDQIDVNVHPAKTEIKFQDERAVFGAVQKAVRQVLVQTAPVPQIEEAHPKFSTPSTPFSASRSPTILSSSRTAPSRSQPTSPAPPPLISLPLLRVLGQLARNYIVTEGPDGLYIIDQHAAHERIMLEKILNQRANRKPEVQGMLEPATFDVEPRQATALNAHLDDLNAVGFSLDAFGDRTYLVRSIPAVLRDRDWPAALREILDGASSDWAENLAITLACHSAIRAGKVLSDDEMRELVKQLEQTSLPNSCPHGRPTIIQLSLSKLEKEFGRS